MRHYDLLKNVFLYTSSNVLNKSIPFLLLPVYTRYLNPSDYGIVVTFQVLLGFMTVVTGISSNGAVMVSFFKLKKQELSEYIGNIFFILLINTVIFCLLVDAFKAILSNYLNLPALWLLISISIALAQSALSITLVIWQAEKKAMNYGLFNFFIVITNAALALYFIVVLGWKWQGNLLGITISTILFGIIGVFILFKRRYISLSFNAEYIKDILRFGVPLVPHSLSGMIMTSIDRIFINSMVSVAATGIYAVGSQVGLIISLLTVSFNTAWAPVLFEKLTENDFTAKIKIVKFTYLYCVIVIIFALLLGLISPTILSILVGKEYQNASVYVIWIALGSAFQGIYLINGLYISYVEKTYFLTIITFSCALLNMGLNYFLIRYNGVIGAAQASCLTSFVFCTATWFLSSKVYKMPWNLLRTEQS